MKQAKEILKDLISVDTSSPEGNESELVKYLYQLFQEKALRKTRRFPFENATKSRITYQP